MVWPIIGRCVAFGSLHLTDAASASQRMAALARACRTRNTWPERGYLPKWLHSAFRFEPRCDNSRMVGQIGIGGGGHPPTPATPPCVRVRTRRVEVAQPAGIDQGL